MEILRYLRSKDSHMSEQLREYGDKQITQRVQNLSTLRYLEQLVLDDIVPRLYELRKEVNEDSPDLSLEDIDIWYPMISRTVENYLDFYPNNDCEVWLMSQDDERYRKEQLQNTGVGLPVITYLSAALATFDFTPSYTSLLISGSLLSPFLIPPLFLKKGIGFSNFNGGGFRVELEQKSLDKMKATMAHEDTHRLQYLAGIPGRNFSYLKEGMAVKVARNLSDSESWSDTSTIYKDLSAYSYILRSAYRQICKSLDIEPRYELFKKDKYMRDTAKKYSIGTTYFQLEEDKHGEGIYSNIISDATNELALFEAAHQ